MYCWLSPRHRVDSLSSVRAPGCPALPPTAWLQACESAGFDAEVDLDVAREAWLGGVDEPGGAKRFRAGGVTFCTLLPLRAIPFQVVCLLGMNDGDYPRRGSRSDFDLMALPGQARPGDRSRRDDDRQLMLDALLSARRVLSISWAGRSPRDKVRKAHKGKSGRAKPDRAKSGKSKKGKSWKR